MSKRTTRSTVAATAALLLLLVLGGQAFGGNGPAPSVKAMGDTTDRVDIKTMPHATSTVRTVELTFHAGSATAWHTHPGPGVITITEGSFVLERVTRRGCIESITYTPGKAFFDDGRTVHRLRAVTAGVVYATFVTPKGEPLGVDETTAPTGPDC